MNKPKSDRQVRRLLREDDCDLIRRLRTTVQDLEAALRQERRVRSLIEEELAFERQMQGHRARAQRNGVMG